MGTCLCDRRDRRRKKERKSEGREKVGQTAATQALNSPLSCFILPSFSSLLPLRGSEGGHPLLQALNQPAADLARPGYSARSLHLSACYAAIPLPCLCSRCQVTPRRAQRCRSTRCPLLCPCCANIQRQAALFYVKALC